MVNQQGASLAHRPIIGGRTWDGPAIDCATCGVAAIPELRAALGLRWWAIPRHEAFSGFAPGDCPGSYRLLGPANTAVVP